MIKPKDLSYEEFPESTAKTDFDSYTRCKVRLNIEYAKKDDHSLTIQMIQADYVQKGQQITL